MQPLPPEEVERLQSVYRRASRNRFQRLWDEGLDHGRERVASSRSSRGRRRPASGEPNGQPPSRRAATVDIPAAAGSARDLPPLDSAYMPDSSAESSAFGDIQVLSSQSEGDIQPTFGLSEHASRVNVIRTAAVRPAGDKSSSSSGPFRPCGFSRPPSDVSDEQSTSPLRRRTTRPPYGLVTPMVAATPEPSVAPSPVVLGFDLTDIARPVQPVETVGRHHRATQTDHLPGVGGAAARRDAVAQARPSTADAGTRPPTMDELAIWQVPPLIDMESIAAMLIQRPSAPAAQLRQSLDCFRPGSDRTEYGQRAMHLALSAMHVFEGALARHLRDQVAATYVDDRTGWAALRRCAVFLQAMATRDGSRPSAPPSPPVVVSNSASAAEDEEDEEGDRSEHGWESDPYI